MRKLFIALILFIMVLIGFTYLYFRQAKKYEKLYLKELQNVEAYQIQNDTLSNTNKLFEYTINQLSISKDSLDERIAKLTKELKIKNKNIQQLQYSKDVITKTDTIIFTDTIFKEHIVIDTLLSDPWYSISFSLRHPSYIKVTPQFMSEKVGVIHTSKEYNKPRSKWWIKRIFQKKHTVINVTVEEKSPYVQNKSFKLIKIVK